jgi:hypothetical protein
MQISISRTVHFGPQPPLSIGAPWPKALFKLSTLLYFSLPYTILSARNRSC